MAIFFVDTSVTLAWCFADEATTETEELLERLKQGDRIIVPAHWPTEVAILNSSGKNSRVCPSKQNRLS
jgi:hypothetical protein